MSTSGEEAGSAPLRPLEAAYAALDSLRLGSREGARGALVEVCSTVEGSLRRVLRDDPDTPLPLRLRALDPGSMPPEEVADLLRSLNRISDALASDFGRLRAACSRVSSGGDVATGDADLAVRVAERTERELGSPSPGPVSSPVEEVAPVHTVPRSVRRRAGAALVGAAVVAALLLALGWCTTQRVPGPVHTFVPTSPAPF